VKTFLVRGLRWLLLAWLLQNLLLVASSALRLEIYDHSYGLTCLHMAAYIWMGLVAAGLVLVQLLTNSAQHGAKRGSGVLQAHGAGIERSEATSGTRFAIFF